MAACDNLVGLKNCLITFTNCDTGQVIAARSHVLSSDEIPKMRIEPYKATAMAGGYTKRESSYPRMEMKIIRELDIPLSWYQGAAAMDVQLEYENGLVYTAKAGTVQGEETSDTHEVDLKLVYKKISELLPDGALANAA